MARLRGGRFTALPPMRTIAEQNSPGLCETVGALLAWELRAVGFDWDFAPVLDVDTNPKNPVIGDRAFSRKPERVAELGLALARGLEAHGVASCAKHFPGHGDTSTDSHLALPSLAFGNGRLERVELHPFKAYSAARLASVMTAHVIYRALDKKRPATMSPAALHGLLKTRLDFRGVVVSDDLEMKAIADHFSVERAAVEGVLAGVDLFLVCRHPDVQAAAIEAVYRAVKRGHIPRARLADAHARLAALEGRFSHGARQLGAPLRSAGHRRLVAKVRAAFDGPRALGVDPTERTVAANHSRR